MKTNPSFYQHQQPNILPQVQQTLKTNSLNVALIYTQIIME